MNTKVNQTVVKTFVSAQTQFLKPSLLQPSVYKRAEIDDEMEGVDQMGDCEEELNQANNLVASSADLINGCEKFE